jgi:putative Mn2+ efflux pump MntP
VFLMASLDRPVLLVFSVAFTAIAMWVMKFVSIFSPKGIRAKDALEELEIRRSPSFGMRNRLMGLVALVLGSLMCYTTFQYENRIKDPEALTGGIIFIALGSWYLIKGKKAESDGCYRALAEEAHLTETSDKFQEAMITALQTKTHLPREHIKTDMDMEIKKIEEQYGKIMKPILDFPLNDEELTQKQLHDAEQVIEELKKMQGKNRTAKNLKEKP